jgi:hypothetical protein
VQSPKLTVLLQPQYDGTIAIMYESSSRRDDEAAFVALQRRFNSLSRVSCFQSKEEHGLSFLSWQERHELPGSGTRSPVEAEAKHGHSEATDAEIYEIPG